MILSPQNLPIQLVYRQPYRLIQLRQFWYCRAHMRQLVYEYSQHLLTMKLFSVYQKDFFHHLNCRLEFRLLNYHLNYLHELIFDKFLLHLAVSAFFLLK